MSPLPASTSSTRPSGPTPGRRVTGPAAAAENGQLEARVRVALQRSGVQAALLVLGRAVEQLGPYNRWPDAEVLVHGLSDALVRELCLPDPTSDRGAAWQRLCSTGGQAMSAWVLRPLLHHPALGTAPALQALLGTSGPDAHVLHQEVMDALRERQTRRIAGHRWTTQAPGDRGAAIGPPVETPDAAWASAWLPTVTAPSVWLHALAGLPLRARVTDRLATALGDHVTQHGDPAFGTPLRVPGHRVGAVAPAELLDGLRRQELSPTAMERLLDVLGPDGVPGLAAPDRPAVWHARARAWVRADGGQGGAGHRLDVWLGLADGAARGRVENVAVLEQLLRDDPALLPQTAVQHAVQRPALSRALSVACRSWLLATGPRELRLGLVASLGQPLPPAAGPHPDAGPEGPAAPTPTPTGSSTGSSTGLSPGGRAPSRRPRGVPTPSRRP